MTANPPILPGCSVLPPMEPAAATAANGKPKGSKRKAADRFAVLNAFVDLTACELTRAEIVVWLILYRDTRDGSARTSQADIARRGGMTPKTAMRAIGRLQRRGLVRAIHRGGLNRGPSWYIIRPLKDWFTSDTHVPSTLDISCQTLGTPTSPIP